MKLSNCSLAAVVAAVMISATNATAQQLCSISYSPVPTATAGSPVTVMFTSSGCFSSFDYEVRNKATNQVVPPQPGDDPRSSQPTARGTVRFTPPIPGTYVLIIMTIPAGCITCQPSSYTSPDIVATSTPGPGPGPGPGPTPGAPVTVSPGTGSPFGGDLVTITGSGFTSVCAVTVGGRPAAVQSVTPTTIQVITPAAGDTARPGMVEVLVTCGASAGTGSFTYRQPRPSLSAINPTSGPVTGGTGMMFAGDEFTTLCTRVTFDGIAATSFDILNRNTIFVRTPPSRGLAKAQSAQVIVDCGSSGMLVSSFTYTAAANPVVIDVIPSVIPPNGGQITVGGANLVASCNVSFGSVRVPPSQVITSGSGLLITAPPNPTEASSSANPRVADPRVPLVIQCGTSISETDFFIANYAAAGFQIAPLNPVAGESVTFDSQSSTGSPLSFSWNFGDGTPVASGPRPAHAFTNSGTFTVTLTTAYSGGVTSTTARRITVLGTTGERVAFTPRLMLPAATRSLGAGDSFFKTQIWLTNRSSQPMTLGLAFIPIAATGTLTDFVTVSVPPFSTLGYADTVLELFGKDALATRSPADAAGNIIVQTANANSPLPFASGRTYTDAGATGSFGQFIPALLLDPAAIYPTSAIIGGLEISERQRTNIGVVNLTAVEFSLTLQALAPNGSPLGAANFQTVLPYSFFQSNNPTGLIPSGSREPFSVAFNSTHPSARFFAYASKVDNSSNDPILIPSTLVPRTEQWIHPIADLQGNSARFRTSLLFVQPNVFQPGALQERLEVFDPQIVPVNTADLRQVFDIAGASRFYSDSFTDLLTNASRGVLYTLHLLSPRPVVLWARFVSFKNIEPAQSFGQLAPAFGREDLIGSNGALLQGLTNDDRSYFNYAVVNVSDSSATATVIVHNNDGSERFSETVTLQPRASTGVRGGVNFAPGVIDGYIIIRPAAGSEGKVYAWATRNDRTSTDSIYIRPQQIPR